MAGTDQQITTSFEFENVIQGESPPSTNMSNETALSIQRPDFESVKRFLERPIRVSTYTWTASSTPGTELFNYSFSNLLTTEPYASKLKGFRSLAADLKIRIVLSASPTQQGALYAKFLPLENNTEYASVYGPHVKTLGSISQLPGLTLQTCHKEAIMTFPLRTPTGVIPLSNPSEQAYYWGKLAIWCLDTLRTGSGSITTCNISVYANLENITLGGPTAPQSGVSKKKRYTGRVIPREKERDDSSQVGVVSGPLIQVSRAANELSGIPLLGPFANSVKWFTNAAAGAARAFGFSKPIIQDPETAMAIYQHLSAFNGDQAEQSVVVSTCRDNSVIIMDDIPGHDEDEMSIDFIKKQWAYFKTTNLTSASSGLVDGCDICPISFDTSYNYTNALGTVAVATRTPIGLLGKLFTYYRGSIKIRVRFIKTKFHSGSLAFIWIPSVYGGTVDDVAQSYAYTHMVDLSEVDQVELELPYLASAPYIPCNNLSGKLYVRVINQLKYPDNVSGTISMIYECCGGDSLKFVVPTFKTAFQPTVTQSGLEESCVESYSNFMSKSDNDLLKITVGENITSLRQLLNAYHPMAITSDSQPTLTAGSVYDPAAIGTYCTWPTRPGTGPYGPGFDLFNNLAMCYLFNRGSVKWRWALDSTSGNVYIVWDIFNFYNPGTLVNDASSFPISLTTLNNNFTGWRVATVSASTGGGSFTFPYLSNNLYKVNIPIYANSTSNQVSAAQIKAINGLRSIIWNAPSTTTKGFISRAIGDDFQFGYWIGVPAG